MKSKLLLQLIMLSKNALYGILLQALLFNFIWAADSNAQEVKSVNNVEVNLDLKNASLIDVFRKIESQTNFVFSYINEELNRSYRITGNYKRTTLSHVLLEISRDANLKFKQVNNNINVTALGDKAPVGEIEVIIQTRNITGKVTSYEDGEGLPGVNVVEKGTSNGTVTDVQGNYSLEVSEGATLVFSSVGYTQEEVEVGNRSTIDLAMTQDIQQLQELVVVGYGTRQKESLTGAISTVPMKNLEKQTISNISQALQGNVAGVTVTNAHTPGSDARIRIRGLSTINNNEPLWVVDGVPTSGGSSQINPNEIESISILKDASATAIYGTRGANGVILVTTKSGKKNQPVQVNVNVRTGVNQATNKFDLLNPAEYGEMLWLQYENSGIAPTDRIFGSEATPNLPEYIMPARANPGSDAVNPNRYDINFPYEDGNGIYQIVKSNEQGTDWYDEIYQNGVIQDYNISVSGGSDNTSYSFLGGYIEEEGIMNYTGFERYSLRANINTNVNNWLSLGENLGVYSSNTYGHLSNNSQSSPVAHAFRVPTFIPVYDIMGGFAGESILGAGDWHNPVAELYRGRRNDRKTLKIIGNTYAQVDFLKDFNFKTQLGIDYENFNGRFPRPPIYEQTKQVQYAQLTLSNNVLRQWNWINTLNYSKNIADIHNVEILIGTEAINHSFENSSASRQNFFSLDDNYMFLSAGELEERNSGSGFEWSTFSQFARINYELKNRYIVEATVRRDGSSRFGINNRYAVFPAISLGWVISEENFASNQNDWLNYLKLRSGIGKTGNDRIGNYNAFTVFNSNFAQAGYPIQGSNSSSSNGFELSAIGNPDAKWETTTTLNLGFDATLFSLIDVSVDVWQKDTKDMLFPIQIPHVLGQASAPSINIGEMQNRGVDISLEINNTSANGKFTYNIGTYVSHYKNELRKISNVEDEFISGAVEGHNFSYTRAEVGTSFPEFFGYIIDGIFQTQDEADNHPTAFGESGTYNEPGHFKYRDFNNDGVITPDDRTYIGSPHPNLTGGINATFTYSSFDLSFNLYGSFGNDIINTTRRWLDFNTFTGNRSKRRLYQSWGSPYLSDNTQAEMPKAELNDANSQLPSTYFIEDGSYLRLNNMQIGFSLPKKFAERLNIKNLRIYGMATNLFTITNYTGLDPEITHSPGNNNVDTNAGIDFGAWPTPRRFLIGINLGI